MSGVRKAVENDVARSDERKRPREDVAPEALAGPDAAGSPLTPGGVLALQRTLGNQSIGAMIQAQRSHQVAPADDGSRSVGRVIARRPLSGLEKEQLSAAKDRLKELEKEYDADTAAILDALQIKNQFNDALAYLHKMDLAYISDRIVSTGKFFKEANELAQQAHSSDKAFDTFMRKLNGYDKSGGKNAIKSALTDLDRKLKSQQRDNLTQVTQLDEDYFKTYLASAKSPMPVYRGNGIGVTATSLDNFVFTDIPAGGTPDISFYGVVQHTHTNTAKNGMVSNTSDFGSAMFFATNSHPYGIVFELRLPNFIHVTNLLNRRNFKERFPGQYEIMAPGPVPANQVHSATLYKNDGTQVKQVINNG